MARNYVLVFWVTPTVRKAIEDWAKTDRRTMSQVCRSVLEDWIVGGRVELPDKPPRDSAFMPLGIRVDEEGRRRLKQVAEKHKVPVSALCGRVMHQWAASPPPRTGRQRKPAPAAAARASVRQNLGQS